MLRHVLTALTRPNVVEFTAKRTRVRKILTWPVDYLPFKWTYPATRDVIAESGDKVSDFGEIDLSKAKKYFGNTEELRDAPDHIKKIFSLEFATRRELTETLKKEFVARVQRHPYDTTSFEYRIANATFLIRSFKQLFVGTNVRNKRLKACLVETIQYRSKMLKFLRRYDVDRYNFVKEKLEIVHEPYPLGIGHQPITRKGELRKLTAEYCKDLKEQKMKQLHEEFLQRQKEFEKEKAEMDKWIADEIKALNLTEEEVASLEYKSSLQ